MICAAAEMWGSDCNCGLGETCSWARIRHLINCHIRSYPRALQLVEIDAREAGAPAWVLRMEEAPGVGWLAHLKHKESGALVPAGPHSFQTREEAYSWCLKAAAK